MGSVAVVPFAFVVVFTLDVPLVVPPLLPALEVAAPLVGAPARRLPNRHFKRDAALLGVARSDVCGRRKIVAARPATDDLTLCLLIGVGEKRRPIGRRIRVRNRADILERDLNADKALSGIGLVV